MRYMYIIAPLIFSFALNMAMFVIAFKKQTDKLTDISYSLTFVGLVVYGYITRNNQWDYAWLVGICVLLWAARLGSYLLIRIRRIGRDKRFDEMRGSFRKFAGFWIIQALTVWIVSFSGLIFFARGHAPETNTMLIGIFAWALGLLIESVADYQKYKFINNPKNKGKWIDSGLWHYSRHPNYFGEILVWYGLWLTVSSGLNDTQKWIAAISPIFIMVLIIFVSGIPMLEKAADAKWGKNPRYKQYKQSTSVLIPLPKK